MNSGYSIKDNTDDLRRKLVELESELKDYESKLLPPMVQEAVLARRHVEDARMRLGLILGMCSEE